MCTQDGLEWEETVDKQVVATVKWRDDQSLNVIAASRKERQGWCIGMAELGVTEPGN